MFLKNLKFSQRISNRRILKSFSFSSSSNNKNENSLKKYNVISSQNYCVDLIKKADFEGYLHSLLMPNVQARQACFALRAFTVETSSVKDVVSKPEIGQMRLAWWKQTIDAIFKKEIVEHPIAISLSEILKSQSLTKGWFTKILDRRFRHLENEQPLSIEELELYCEETFSSMFYLMLESMNVKTIDTDHIASHLGKAMGVATLLRALPITLSKNEILLPQQLMAQHRLSNELAVRANQPDEQAARAALAECVYELACKANDHLQHAQSLEHKSGHAADAVFAACVPTQILLERLEKNNFDVYDSALQQRPVQLYWRLWRGVKRGKWRR